MAIVPRITAAVTFMEGGTLCIRNVEKGSVLLTGDSCISSSLSPYRCKSGDREHVGVIEVEALLFLN